MSLNLNECVKIAKENVICKLCSGETLEPCGDTVSLDERTLFMSTEGDFGETVFASFKIKICPLCGRKL